MLERVFAQSPGRAKGGDQIIQSAAVTGDRNVTTTIAGLGNVIR